MELAYFKSITNNTSKLVRLTYWEKETCGLNRNVVVNIDPGQTLQTPTNYVVDEFIVVSENYSYDLFKFRHEPAADRERIWVFVSDITVSEDNGDITINAK
jgi:hypothetical protein